jgi:hypothetical protein
MEGRGFSPAVKLRRDLGALAPEATRLQGLKAHSTLHPEAAGLKPRPSTGHKQYRLLLQVSTKRVVWLKSKRQFSRWEMPQGLLGLKTWMARGTIVKDTFGSNRSQEEGQL